jgi:hypothetical protein
MGHPLLTRDCDNDEKGNKKHPKQGTMSILPNSGSMKPWQEVSSGSVVPSFFGDTVFAISQPDGH